MSKLRERDESEWEGKANPSARHHHCAWGRITRSGLLITLSWPSPFILPVLEEREGREETSLEGSWMEWREREETVQVNGWWCEMRIEKKEQENDDGWDGRVIREERITPSLTMWIDVWNGRGNLLKTCMERVRSGWSIPTVSLILTVFAGLASSIGDSVPEEACHNLLRSPEECLEWEYDLRREYRQRGTVALLIIYYGSRSGRICFLGISYAALLWFLATIWPVVLWSLFISLSVHITRHWCFAAPSPPNTTML